MQMSENTETMQSKPMENEDQQESDESNDEIKSRGGSSFGRSKSKGSNGNRYKTSAGKRTYHEGKDDEAPINKSIDENSAADPSVWNSDESEEESGFGDSESSYGSDEDTS